MSMKQLLGEYDVRLDDKGRFRMPTAFLNQLGDWQRGNFIINRGFEKCLVLYPEPLWNEITAELDGLNIYNKKNRDFVRYFFRGASEVTLDSAQRFLLPKTLADYANIDKDIKLTAYSGRIELWATEEYDKWMEEEPLDFSELADEVLGGISRKGESE
ncbi:MAG: division/cell wall cluster transcriptional repressor MraZ [Saprospiraceae bacterium]